MQTQPKKMFGDFDRSQCGVVIRAKLSMEQERFWTISRAKFLWEQPAFSHILYTMMDPSEYVPDKAIFTDEVPIAATDGKYLLLNPDTFFKYPLPQRVFIIGHEVLHNILNHMILFYNLSKIGKVKFKDGTELPFYNQTMQLAADYVINDILVQSQVGQKPPDCYHDPVLIPGTMSVIDAYKKVYQEDQKRGGNGDGSRMGSGGQSFDVHLLPGKVDKKPAEVAKQDRNETEWKVAVKSAMASAQAQGKLPGFMKDMFAELLQPRVSWEEHIEAWFARSVGSGTYSWKQPDRRLITRQVAGLAADAIYAPGRQGYASECIVVVVDTSGSVNKPTLDMFFGEMSGVLENVKPKRLIVIWCDSRVHRVDEVEDAQDLMTLFHKGAPGRGGTAFKPAFDEVAKLGIDHVDALVYLTDLEGPTNFPAPSYPVLWGCITDKKAPWGTTVNIPKQADK
jgi:predicted metal-dependent peptidase